MDPGVKAAMTTRRGCKAPIAALETASDSGRSVAPCRRGRRSSSPSGDQHFGPSQARDPSEQSSLILGLNDAAGAEKAVATGWKAIPSWWVYGDADRNIPPAAMKWMAARAHAKQVVTIRGTSHVVMISHPREVSKLIETAAR